MVSPPQDSSLPRAAQRAEPRSGCVASLGPPRGTGASATWARRTSLSSPALPWVRGKPAPPVCRHGGFRGCLVSGQTCNTGGAAYDSSPAPALPGDPAQVTPISGAMTNIALPGGRDTLRILPACQLPPGSAGPFPRPSLSPAGPLPLRRQTHQLVGTRLCPVPRAHAGCSVCPHLPQVPKALSFRPRERPRPGLPARAEDSRHSSLTLLSRKCAAPGDRVQAAPPTPGTGETRPDRGGEHRGSRGVGVGVRGWPSHHPVDKCVTSDRREMRAAQLCPAGASDWEELGSPSPFLPSPDGKTEAHLGGGVARVAGTGPALGWVPGGALQGTGDRGLHMGVGPPGVWLPPSHATESFPQGACWGRPLGQAVWAPAGRAPDL